jgi:hypothetical protein
MEGYNFKGRVAMKQSEIFRENAEHCAYLAESSTNEPTFRRYKRMEAAWLALAYEQDWLDGEIAPIQRANGTPPNVGAER